MRVCSKCGRNRALKFYRGTRGTICLTCRKSASSDNAHAIRILKLYELSREDYAALYTAQGGKCAICREPRKYRLNVDHSHALAKLIGLRRSVRGLLCRRCNKLLRDVRDNIELLQWAAEYLSDPPSRKVIPYDG